MKTGLVGWYLNRARTLAVAPDGRYFQLVTAGSTFARFTGVTPSPIPPTLVIGRGDLDKDAQVMMGLPYYETRWWKNGDYGRTLWWDREGTIRPLLRGYFHDDINQQVKLVKGCGSIPPLN